MAKDLLLDEQDDLLFEGGDLVIGTSEEQEIGLILRGNPGDWRAAPLIGFGIVRKMRLQLNKDQFVRELDTQLRLDGFVDNSLTLASDGTLKISANRNE